MAVLRDASQGAGTGDFAVIQAMAPLLRLQVNAIDLREAGEIESAIAAFARSPNGGLIMPGSAAGRQYRDLIIALLRRRIAATRWPDRETVADQSQGVQLAKLQETARYWGTDYDWRKIETKLNTLPQFVTTIDGVDIHFIQVRSRNANALPVIITHGWPGSVIEQLKLIDPLTNPPRTEAAPRMRSTSSSRPCRAMASPAGRPARVGTLIALREPGQN